MRREWTLLNVGDTQARVTVDKKTMVESIKEWMVTEEAKLVLSGWPSRRCFYKWVNEHLVGDGKLWFKDGHQEREAFELFLETLDRKDL